MKINKSDENLIIQATKDIKTQRKAVQDVLISLAESYNWFHDGLRKILQKGVTFTEESIDTIAKYRMTNDQIIINKSLLKANIPKSLLLEALAIFCRHEVTHAIDHLQRINGEKESLDVARRFLNYQKLANLLYNKLTCIYNNLEINKNALNKLSPLLYKPYNGTGHIISAQDTNIGLKRLPINYVGSYPDSNNINSGWRYILDFWQLANSDQILYAATYDRKLIYDLFQTTRLEYKGEFDDYFNQFFETKQLKLWNMLSERERQILNALFIIGGQIFAYVQHDPECFPIFADCLTKSDVNCLNDLLTCQLDKNATAALITYMEIRAGLQERSEGQLLRLEDLDKLCPLPAKKPINIQHKNESIVITQPPVSNFALVGKSILQGATYSFFDDIAKLYMEHKDVKNITVLKTLANVISYLLTCSLISYLFAEENSSSPWQFTLGTAFILLNNWIEYSNFLSPRANIITKNILTATTLSIESFFDGPQKTFKTFVGSAIGSTIGYSLAGSMAKGLQWKKPPHKIHEELMQKTAPILKKHENQFATFINAMNEQNYSKALRTACTSSHPDAFELIKILLTYREDLNIDIDDVGKEKEQAAVHHAAMKGNKKVYDFLVKHGANINLPDKSGHTAAEYYSQPKSSNLDTHEQQQYASI